MWIQVCEEWGIRFFFKTKYLLTSVRINIEQKALTFRDKTKVAKLVSKYTKRNSDNGGTIYGNHRKHKHLGRFSMELGEIYRHYNRCRGLVNECVVRSPRCMAEGGHLVVAAATLRNTLDMHHVTQSFFNTPTKQHAWTQKLTHTQRYPYQLWCGVQNIPFVRRLLRGLIWISRLHKAARLV